MPKYRRLNKEELTELEKDFIRFLATNTVTGDDWETLKKENPDKAEGYVDTFSDLVFERILQKAEYMELKSKQDVRTFHCQEETIKMIGILIEGDTSLDFTQNIAPEQMMQMLSLSQAKLKLYSGERKYRKDRELELFELLEQGALISKDGALYKTLQGLKKG